MGLLAYYRVPNPKRSKLGPKALRCTFQGNAHNSNANISLDLYSNIFLESSDVDFFRQLWL